MNKNTLIALILVGMMVGTIGAIFAKRESRSAPAEPLFVG
jgi:hypothetical protein